MKKKWSGKMMIKTVLVLLLTASVGFAGYIAYATYKLNQLSEMTFEDMLMFTTRDNKEAVITVGILQGNEMRFEVYGENGKRLPDENHIYEIGSITKTFTTSLLQKGISEGRISMDDSIDKYLSIQERNDYPTIRKLMTHTSGYKGEYFEKPMISNFFRKANSFHNITGDMVRRRAEKVELNDTVYPFRYSNFGMALLGQVLEVVHEKSYMNLMNDYISNDLRLEHTKISDGSGDLSRYWVWSEDDAYLSAGAVVSDITDMMKYAKMQMDEEPVYLHDAHIPLGKVKSPSRTDDKMGIFIHEVASGWMVDNENEIIWHNGGTRNYNSYIGIDRRNEIGVVVLSNLSPDYRIPTTVLGIELLKSLKN